MIRKNFNPSKYGCYVTTLWNRRERRWEYAYHKTLAGAERFWKNKVEVDTTYDVYMSRMAHKII